MKYIISTLGCKVNQYETQAMETYLRERGHESASPGETADAVIVNTCAVTAESGRKSRQTIRRLRDENPGAVVGVCGCYAQISPEEAREIGADVIFGAADRAKFVEAVERAAATGERATDIDDVPLADGTVRVLVEGEKRARISDYHRLENYDEVEAKVRSQIASWRAGTAKAAESTALAESLTITAAAATGANKTRIEALAGILQRQGTTAA